MNWFKNLFLKTAQQRGLSINGLRSLLGVAPDMPGQQYLFQGPDISELQRLRNMTPDKVAKIHEAIDLMIKMFEVVGDELQSDVTNYDLDDEEIEEEVNQYVDMYLQDFDFNNEDEMWNFLESLTYEDREQAWLKAFNLPYRLGAVQEELPNQHTFNRLMYQLNEWHHKRQGWSGETHVPRTSIRDVIDAYTDAQRDPDNYRETALFLEVLSAFTEDIMDTVIEQYNRSTTYYRRREHDYPAEFPPWIDEDKLRHSLLNDFESDLFEWYKSYNRDQLRDAAADSLNELRYENYREDVRSVEHEHGEDIIELLSSDFEQEEDDERMDMQLYEINSIANSLSDKWLISGAQSSSEYISMYIYGIHNILTSDDDLKFIFDNDLHGIVINPELIAAGANRAIADSSYIPPAARTEEVEQLLARLEEMKLNAEKYHEMLNTKMYRLSPEELQKMRELGIAKKPFGHQYILERRTYPGAGFSKIKGMEPFRISVSPTKEYADDAGIPSNLLHETTLHNVESPGGVPALGWIGGYADYARRIMYIAEVQSDTMQRTVHMRDPEKLEKMRAKEITRLQQEIANIQQSLQNAISPKQKMIQTLDKVRLENQTLDPNSPKYLQNQKLIDRLLGQLPQVPDIADPSQGQAKIQQLQTQMSTLQKSRKPSGDQFSGKYKQWHDYKSKVENTYKEWIPIFFNIALREAKQRGFEKVRIISADSLMKLWSAYAEPETRTLFERIYDNTAKQYGAQPISEIGKNWYEIDLLQTQRIAQTQGNYTMKNNWFQKIHKLANHEWLAPLAPGSDKYVWQVHLDKFFEVMKRRSPELQAPEFDTGVGYMDNESNNFIFNEWLMEVPNELKIGEDLHPRFKDMVQNYLIQKYQFDPFENEEIDIPSADEMNEQWG